MRKKVLAATLVALVGSVGGARASTGPGYESDLQFGSTPSHGGLQHKGAEMLERMGRTYHTLQLLSALETVNDAIEGGKLIPAEAQEALHTHGVLWRATYAEELGERTDLDELWTTTMVEQQTDRTSPSRDYERVSLDLHTLYLATSRYNQALSLQRNGLSGFTSSQPREEGTVGLDQGQYGQVVAMLDGLRTQISGSTTNIRTALQNS